MKLDQKEKRSTNKLKRTNTLTAYLFITPSILGLIFLTILPILGVIVISLTNWSGLEKPAFIGMDNYIEIFTSDFYFTKSVVATLYFALGAVITGILYSFFMALLLNQPISGRGAWRSILFMPYIVPVIGSSIVWSWMYEANFGVFNWILNLFGLDKVQWLQNDTLAMPSLILMMMWTSGNLIVIFLAGLQGVPKMYLEAVEVDGGNFWHKFKHITLPMMSPIIFYNFLMSLITNLQGFVPAYTMTKGGPSDSTLLMVYLIYREGFMRNNFGHASALSVLFFLFIAILTVLIFRTSKVWTFYESQ
ncbi:MAG TPA: sugar ABC transporter permease [Bacillota bacterium]|nr:sugar ABC transporter permease [Bacillota bacterium]